MNEIFFSNIIGTLNRPDCLDSCLGSLEKQSYKNFEVVIIDQSDDDLSTLVAEKYSRTMTIKYRKVKFRGLSKARNEALKIAEGNYFCLLDDDAFYDPDYLDNATEIIKRNVKNVILSGFIWDTVFEKPFVKYPNKKGGLTVNEVIRYCPSAALIIPYQVYKDIGGFDENFGVGAKFGCGEETDYLLRAVNNNYVIIHSKELYLSHPVQKNCIVIETSSDKQKYYAKGIGALYKKHFWDKKELKLIWPFIERLIKPAIKMMLPFKYDFRKSFAEFCGFLVGLKEYKNEN